MDNTPDIATYFHELDRLLTQLFTLSNQGVRPPIEMKHRCEGYMRAAVVLGIANNAEIQQRMESIHQTIFGMSIAERRARKQAQGVNTELDYSYYDTPTYTRTPN